MAECAFDMILEEWLAKEWDEFSDVPEFETSKKHDRAMKRIFKRYERNTRKMRPRSDVKVGSVTKKILIAVLALFLALIAGCAATYFISHGFRSSVYPDAVEIFLYNGTDNCPNTLENTYYLSGLPEDYEIIRTNNTTSDKSVLYRNTQTGQLITFEYSVKSNYFYPIYFDTENGRLSEIEINGGYGLYHEYRGQSETDTVALYNDYYHSKDNICIWDNGDYIFEIRGNLPKKDMINLAKSAKVL